MNRRSNHKYLITLIAAVLAAGLLLAACVPVPPAGSVPEPTAAAAPATVALAASPVPPSRTAQVEPAPIATEADLKDGTYDLPDMGAVQLKEGKFEQPSGGATEVKAAGFEGSATGDLNGDGKQDAVVELWTNTGGTGVFHYLVALLNQDGKLRQAASTLLGDRMKLNALTIEPSGGVVIGLTGFKASDPLCCPSQPMTRTYQLEGDALKLLSEVNATATP